MARKNALYGLMAVSMGVLIYLACVELAIGLFDERLASRLYSWRSFHITDEVTGWALQPGASGLIPMHSGLIRTTINSHGQRDDEYSYEKSEGTSRIMFLGDSFLYDNAFRHQETYHYMTEFRLGRWGYPVEIINTGVNGYGTGQEYLYYKYKGAAFKPDIVILHIYVGNDIRDNAAGVFAANGGGDVRAPYFKLTADKSDVTLHNFPYHGGMAGSFIDELNDPISLFGFEPFRILPLRSLRLHENVLNQIYRYKIAPLLNSGAGAGAAHAGEGGEQFDKKYGSLFVENPSPQWVDALTITKLLILKLRNEVEKNGAKLGVVLIPSRAQMNESEAENPGLYTVDKVLLSFLEQKEIPHLHLYKYFSALHNRHAELYEGGVHWNSGGHAVGSWHVAKWLVETFGLQKGEAQEWKFD